jgi:hypothetical protein
MDNQRVGRESLGCVTTRRFSLKQLFSSLTLAGLGLAMIGSLAPRECDLTHSLADISAALTWLGGGMFLGAGLLLPFNRQVLGAVLGFTVPFLILLIPLISVSAYLFGLLNAGAMVAGALWLMMRLEGMHTSTEPLPKQFSLRTLLIATTLVALVLGLIVAVLRWPMG